MSRTQFENGINPGQLSADPSSAKAGDIYFNTVLGKTRIFNGTAWANVGSGSGGGKNYLTDVNNNPGNGDFELNSTTGWSLGTTGTLTNGLPTGSPTFGSGASGNLSISTVSSGQLAGSYSLSYTSSAATTQGNMLASDAFSIDLEDQAKVLTWKFYYKAQTNPGNANWSGTSSNSFGVAVWDVTNSAWLPTTASFGMTQSSGVGIVSGTVQTASNAAQLRLVVYNVNATSGAITLYFDDFSFGPQTTAIGVPSTDWSSFLTAPTGSWTSNATYSGKWRRIGDSAEIVILITCTGAPTATALTLNMPNGWSIDTNKLSGASTPYVGVGRFQDVGVREYPPGLIRATSATTLDVRYLVDFSNNLAVTNTAPLTFGNNDFVECTFRVPIVGWASNVQMSSDTDTRVVAARYYASAGQAIGTGATLINYDVMSIDTHAAVTTGGSWAFRTPVAGIYEVTAQWINSGSGLFTFNIDIYKNGAVFAHYGTARQANNGAEETPTIRTLVPLVPGDTIQIFGYSNGSGPMTASPAANFVAINRLSGPSVIAATESVNANYATSAGQSIPNNTSTVVIFGTKNFDSHNSMNSSTGVYTCPVSGKYQVSAGLYSSSAITATATDVQVQVLKNGSVFQATNTPKSGTSAAPVAGTGSFIVSCNAGDTISIAMFQNTGSSQNLLANAAYNWITISRIGN